MAQHFMSDERAHRISKALLDKLGVDPKHVEDGTVTADWVSGDDNVLIRWTGIAKLPRQVVHDIVEDSRG